MNFFVKTVAPDHCCKQVAVFQAPASRSDGPETKTGVLQIDGGSEKILELFVSQELKMIAAV
jgi:hypothetical protein